MQEADLQLLTRVGSFLHLLHSCREQEGYLSPAPPTQPAANDNGVYLLDSESALSVEVPFHLSSLFSCSRAVTFELDVFSEGKLESTVILIMANVLFLMSVVNYTIIVISLDCMYNLLYSIHFIVKMHIHVQCMAN